MRSGLSGSTWEIELSEQLGRSLEGHVETIPAAVQKGRADSVRIDRGMRAIINIANLKASKACANLDVILGEEGREVNATQIAFFGLHGGRYEDVIDGKQLRSEGSFDSVIGSGPEVVSVGVLDGDVVLKVQSS